MATITDAIQKARGEIQLSKDSFRENVLCDHKVFEDLAGLLRLEPGAFLEELNSRELSWTHNIQSLALLMMQIISVEDTVKMASEIN
jgi:hypothetical protein